MAGSIAAIAAYMAGGDVYVTGRIKDIIIRAGRHLYPQEIEEAVAEIPGIHKGGVAVLVSPIAHPAPSGSSSWLKRARLMRPPAQHCRPRSRDRD